MVLFGRKIEVVNNGMTCENLSELLDKINWCVKVGLMDDNSNLRLQPYAMSVIMSSCRYLQ